MSPRRLAFGWTLTTQIPPNGHGLNVKRLAGDESAAASASPPRGASLTVDSDDVIFEWDGPKAAANLKKHHVAFEAAATVFFDPLAITFPDPDHSADERREITIGHTIKNELVLVSHCERGERVRIIGARRATRTERKQYEQGIGT